MSRSLKAHILLVLVTVVWGSTFVLIKQALNDASPLILNAIRMTFAAVVLGVVYRRQLRRITRASFFAGALVGLFLWIGFEFQTVGLGMTTASKSAFVTGMHVVLVPVFLTLIWRRPVNRWTVLGVCAACVGLYFMTVPAGEETFSLSALNRGDLLTVVSAIAFAFQVIFTGRTTQTHAFEHIAFMQVAVSAVLMLVTAPLVEQVRIAWSPTVIATILITGLLGTAAAFSIQAWAQQFTPPTHAALIFSLEPVFAWLTSLLFLGERLGARAGLGAALILGGVLLSELKGSAVKRPAEFEPLEHESLAKGFGDETPG